MTDYSKNNTQETPAGAIRLLAIYVLCALILSGCGKEYEVFTPKDFVVLEDSAPYDYRATTSDGLVVGLRTFSNKKSHGELEFWSQAIENELRLAQGYSLLTKDTVQTNTGLKGTALHFGYDKDEKAHLYQVFVFSTKNRVYVLEAGGLESLVLKHQAQIDWTVQEFIARK